MELVHTVDAGSAGKTVKHILKNRMKLSERLIKRLKLGGRILKNSVPVYVNQPVAEGDTVKVLMDFDEECRGIIPEKMELEIIYEDQSMVALNKPSGIVVHPTARHPAGTIANGLSYYLAGKGEHIRIRPVSRLDRDTTGLIIFAKNQYVQEQLVRQMGAGTFCKRYLGIIRGSMEQPSGTIDLPIARKPGSIIRREVSESGVSAVTHYKTLEHFYGASLVEFTLETGRTHQIRVHCEAAGHPLIGDSLYPGDSPEEAVISRQALHSHAAGFLHPVSGSPMELTAPVPSDMLMLMEILRK